MKYKDKEVAQLESDDSLMARKSYYNDVMALIGRLSGESARNRTAFMPPEALAADHDRYLTDFRAMLGRPLSDYKDGMPLPEVRETVIAHDDMGEVRRVRIEIIEGVWGEGLLFLPPEYGKRALPFIISQHGGDGTPELCSAAGGGSANYNDMTRRVLELGAVVYAPFMLTGASPTSPQRMQYSRDALENSLRQFGYNMTALEVVHVMRAIDYYSTVDGIDENRAGMIGLSWGGYYTVMCAAADPRIKCAYSSGQFNDRVKYNWQPWVFNNSGNTFLDAEVAALIAPRRLYIECGRTDDLFAYENAQSEYERLLPYYREQNAESELRFSIHDGPHELDRRDDGVRWTFEKLI